MREIKGFCCVAEADDAVTMQVLFGKNTGKGQGLYESLQSNGLVPFLSIAQAKKAKRDLAKRQDFRSVKIVKLEIIIAEIQEEIARLHAKENFIVLWQLKESGYEEFRLIGRYVEGRPGQYPLPGASLNLNGCRPILSLKSAIYIGDEVNRQGEGIAYIGTMVIKKIK